MASPDPSGGRTTNRDGWLDLLAAMEADLAAHRAMANAGATPVQTLEWNAPAGLGPMPTELASRARTILDALQADMLEVEAERTRVGHHLAALRSAPSVTVGDQAIYLDVTG